VGVIETPLAAAAPIDRRRAHPRPPRIFATGSADRLGVSRPARRCITPFAWLAKRIAGTHELGGSLLDKEAQFERLIARRFDEGGPIRQCFMRGLVTGRANALDG
jgi:hypothetical protein